MSTIWIAAGAVVLIDLLIWPFAGMSLHANATRALPTAASLVAVFIAQRLVMMRLHNDPSNDASAIRYHLRALSTVVDRFVRAGIPIAIFGAAVSIYSCLVIRPAWTLRDADLAVIDAALGFHWPDWLSTTNTSPIATAILLVSYHSFVPQLVFVIGALSMRRSTERLSEFLVLFVLTLGATALISTVVPAAGAHFYFSPDSELYSNIGFPAGAQHLGLLAKLRAADEHVFDPFSMAGMITFPSFHAAAAIILAYAVRGIFIVGPLSALLNATMVVSAIPVGAHYMVDVIAGVAVALASIAAFNLARSSDRRRTSTRRIWL